VAEAGQECQRARIDRALRLAARRECAKAVLAFTIENGFGHDRAGGIAGAEKQDVVKRVGHRASRLAVAKWLFRAGV
jgi:hypothetical protein